MTESSMSRIAHPAALDQQAVVFEIRAQLEHAFIARFGSDDLARVAASLDATAAKLARLSSLGEIPIHAEPDSMR